MLSQLLNEMDGVEALVNVTVIAATNRPDILVKFYFVMIENINITQDHALLRPGRIDRILYVSPPDELTRLEILKIQTRKMSIDTDVDLTVLAQLSKGFSGAETVYICQEAGMLAMEENLDAEKVSMRHFLAALEKITPRISQEMLNFYREFQQKSGLKIL